MTLAKDIIAIARRGVGVLANCLVALDANGKLPAVDGGQLLNVVRRRTSSGLLTPTLAGTLTWAHGLGAAPTRTWATIVCQMAETGYAVGDEVEITGAEAYAIEQGYGIMLRADATNVKGLIGNTYLAMILNASTAAGSYAPALANWKVKLWAEL